MNTTEFHIRGITPLLMHNGQLADPLNEYAQALSRLTKKRNKTDDDHRAARRAEWIGGLYVDENGEPCLPGEVIEGALTDGAKTLKLGQAAKGGLIVDGNFALVYKGPRAADELWEHGGFKKLAGVKVQKARVIRCRPMFAEWACRFTVEWDPELIKNERQLGEIVECAGRKGIGDWRPKFGRFEVV